MKRTNIKSIIISVCLILAMAVNFSGCAFDAQAADLMENVKANAVEGKSADTAFLSSQMRFAVEMFKLSLQEKENENVLVSPLCVQLALAMTANGAKNDTKAEMEKLLGGDIPLEKLNEYLYSYVNSLKSEDNKNVKIANSVWFTDDERFSVQNGFLQTNADYYGAQMYKTPFNNRTADEINKWVRNNTDGLVDKIIDEINPNALMYLVSALAFEAEWESAYEKYNLDYGKFKTSSGEMRTVEMMTSEENGYIEEKDAKGFVKNYKGGKYSFVALLPNEGINVYDYAQTLSGEKLSALLNSAENCHVTATMPKFSFDYSADMKQLLSKMGMPSAFDEEKADFSSLGKSSRGNIFIGEVVHKTHITVDEQGTKAGAAAEILILEKSTAYLETERIILDRPFLFMIVDNSTNLPIFMGAAADIQK